MRKSITIAKGIISLGALAAIIIGSPIALAMLIGNPLPGTEQVDIWKLVFEGVEPIPGHLVIDLLAMVLWVLWALLVISMTTETVSAIKNQTTTLRIPGIQQLARHSILTITMLLALVKPAGANISLPESSLVQPLVESQTKTPQKTSSADMQQSEAKLVSYLTKEGDSWYSISEEFYGSGHSFNKIRQANLGKTFETITVTNSTEFVSAGWLINIPTTEFQTIDVQSGDTVWEIAEDNITEAGGFVSLADIANDMQTIVERNQMTNPDLIYPQQQIEIPNYSNAEPAPTSVPSETTKIPNATTPQHRSSTQQTMDSEYGNDDDSGALAWPIAAGVTTVIGAWYLKALVHKRRRKLRARKPNPSKMTNEANLVELSQPSPRRDLTNLLNQAEQTDKAKLLEVACRALSTASQNLGILTVAAKDNQVHFIGDPEATAEPTNTLAPEFERIDGTRTWVFTPPSDLTSYDQSLSYAPIGTATLIPLGTLPNGAITFLNLEQVRSVAIEAQDAQSQETFLVDTAVSLATSPLAYDIRIILIGTTNKLSGVQRVEHHENLTDGLLQDLALEQERLAVEDTIEGRLSYMDASYFDPVVVIAANPEDAEQIDALRHPAAKGAIVIVSTNENGWTIKLGDQAATLTCPDLPTPANQVTFTRPANTEAIRDLVVQELQADTDAIEDTSLTTVEESPPPSLQDPTDLQLPRQDPVIDLRPPTNQTNQSQDPQSVPCVDPVTPEELGIEFLVRCLGRVKIGDFEPDADTKPWTYIKSPELVVLLALNPKGLHKDTAVKHLWPQDPHNLGNYRRLSRALSEARIKILGRKTDGSYRVPNIRGKSIVTFDDTVGTDIQIFEETINRANAATDRDTEIGHLRNALALVTGAPFTLPNTISGYGWDINHRENLTIQIEDTATRLYELTKTASPAIALEAAKAGLRTGTQNYHLKQCWLEAANALEDSDEVALATIAINQDDFAAEPQEIETQTPQYLKASMDLIETKGKK